MNHTSVFFNVAVTCLNVVVIFLAITIFKFKLWMYKFWFFLFIMILIQYMVMKLVEEQFGVMRDEVVQK